MGVLCCVLVFCVLLCVLSIFATIPLEKREMVALFMWHTECHVSRIDLCFFLNVPCVGLYNLIVVFSCYTHLLFAKGLIL